MESESVPTSDGTKNAEHMADRGGGTTIITVHGVGSAEPGDTLRSMLTRKDIGGQPVTMDRLMISGTEYERARIGGHYTLVEVRWSDLRRKATGPLKLILEIIAILTAMLQTAHRSEVTGKSCSLFFAGLYHRLFIEALRPGTAEFRIVCHSQGTVIAAAVLKDLLASGNLPSGLRLTTMGSPIESLYRLFLDMDPLPDAKSLSIENAFRGDDYIGGLINDNRVYNAKLGRGGHTDYWSQYSIPEGVVKNIVDGEGG